MIDIHAAHPWTGASNNFPCVTTQVSALTDGMIVFLFVLASRTAIADN